MKNAGAEVKLHPMLHARILLWPTRRFLIVGSEDLQTDCLGGTRFDARMMSKNLELIKARAFSEYQKVKPTFGLWQQI